MIGYGRQHIDEDDVAAVVDVLRGSHLTCGPAIPAFEQAICHLTGAAHAVAVANGTSALRLLYQAVGVGPGVRVGVPAITFLATASQALMLGAEVHLLDVDPLTGLLTPEILDAYPQQLDWVVPVHLAGRLCDMPAIAAIAAKKGIRVIEDAAHAFGSTWNEGQRCGDGTWSEGAIFSFHPVKNITTGEGGAITVADPAIAERLRSLRHHGVVTGGFQGDLAQADADAPWYHEFQHIAGNERLSDLHAALGTSQCHKLPMFKAERQAHIDAYVRAFAGKPGITMPITPSNQQPFWHLCPALVDWATVDVTRSELFTRSRQAGIALQVHYIPLHMQPVCKPCQLQGAYPGAMAWYGAEVSLPCYPGLDEKERNQVIATLCEILGMETA